MVRVWLIVAVVFTSGCGGVAVPEEPARQVVDNLDNTPLPRTVFLHNMPTNSDKRCVGIVVVAEALADGIEIDEDTCDEVRTIAQRVYDRQTTGQRVRYHRQVLIADKRVPIHSEAALDRLGTIVAELYKRDYIRLTTTEVGRQKLYSAHYSFVAASRELNRILDADPDKTVAFFGTGTRVFPDERVEETSHAFLISKQPNGNMIVYDANDPGAPINCQVADTEEGVEVEWSCRYRDTGRTTTQSYLVVDRETAFGAMLGQ